jgi:hypothetical protein
VEPVGAGYKIQCHIINLVNIMAQKTLKRIRCKMLFKLVQNRIEYIDMRF